MVAQCTAHSQLKSVYGVSGVMYHHKPSPPITSQRSEGLGLGLLWFRTKVHFRQSFAGHTSFFGETKLVGIVNVDHVMPQMCFLE